MHPAPAPGPALPTLRIVFFGTADLACASLAALAQHRELHLPAVVTQPDRPRGRDLQLQPTPVKALATRLDLPVWQPARCRAPEFLDQLRAAAPDLVIVAAYGQLLPPALLGIPRFGCLNVHTSLLPRHRGAAPIQWAILEGDAVTGVTIMQVDAGLDTGAMLAHAVTPVRADDTAQTLHDRLATLGADLLLETLPGYVAGTIRPVPQPAEGVTYARKITKEDGHLDWTRPADVLHRRLRAFTPWPGTYTHLPGPAESRRLLKVWAATPDPADGGSPGEILTAGPDGILVRCGTDALRITELQREGGRRLPAADFLAGHPLPPGTVLG